MPGEYRTWKVFCLDIWKQLFTAGFAHTLNIALSIYLQELTKEGNGCVWYLVTMLLDCLLGMLLAYILFRIVDEIAIKFGIEVSLSLLLAIPIYLILPGSEKWRLHGQGCSCGRRRRRP